MKVSDVIHGRVATIDLHLVEDLRNPPDLAPKTEVLLRYYAGGVWNIEVAGVIQEVEGATQSDCDTLLKLNQRGLPRLAWVVQFIPSARVHAGRTQLLIQVHEFPVELAWDEPMKIGVDDRLLDSLRKLLRRSISVQGAVEWIEERVLLPPKIPKGESHRALLSGSPGSDRKRAVAFRLHGSRYAVDVRHQPNNRLRATRVVNTRRRIEGGNGLPIYIVDASIRFCDMTQAGEFRGAAQTELDRLVAQADSYLGLWGTYNKKEREVILRRARTFGWLAYSKVERLANGDYRFHLVAKEADNLKGKLDAVEGESLEADDEVPSNIQGTASDVPSEQHKRPFIGTPFIDSFSPPRLKLRAPPDHDDRNPPKKGYLFVSLEGDVVRMKRRKEAWHRIRSCDGPMPQLGLIIEGRPVPERRGRYLEPYTKAVHDVFENPTDRQKLALDVALNTPDIALIQGPPGTGKTRVIAALQARLAEADEGVGPGGLSGNTLLTSFQHDAVETAAMATRVLGLPAVKIGYRRGSVESRDGVDIWAVETANAVRANGHRTGMENTVHASLRNVRQTALAYLRSPSHRDNPAQILRKVLEIAGRWLPTTLIDDIERLQVELKTLQSTLVGEDDRNLALRAARALRSEAVAFLDDGPANAYRLLRSLERLESAKSPMLQASNLLTTEEKSCLKRAASVDLAETVDEVLLSDLQLIKNKLIDRLFPADVGNSSPHVHVDVESLINRVIDALTERSMQSAQGAEIAITEWVTDLENDPEGIRETLQHYSMVLAATCQQSVSRPMADAKGGDDTVFRTVIVDEAARSNPLDLLIPMACAERRIVLVGDHRQLPHLLEPDIEHEIQESAQLETRKALSESLFEKLFKELRKREGSDGIKRSVTLDTQYRMHPHLGEFVSEQFYGPYGEGFKSGRGEGEFAHSVVLTNGTSLAGKVAAWINIPYARGGESGRRSKKRPVEARRVAKEAHAVVQRHPELSVGVITFYAAQRDEILESLSKDHLGLTEPMDEGGYRIRDEWRQTTDGRDRLRIGTVDAFQGKEFDIVFLSLTRSNNVSVKSEALRRRRYGFLLLTNRLCVAMSRQQRLLIVVGDQAMAADSGVHDSVPALTAFLKLCGGPHGRVVRI